MPPAEERARGRVRRPAPSRRPGRRRGPWRRPLPRGLAGSALPWVHPVLATIRRGRLQQSRARRMKCLKRRRGLPPLLAACASLRHLRLDRDRRGFDAGRCRPRKTCGRPRGASPATPCPTPAGPASTSRDRLEIQPPRRRTTPRPSGSRRRLGSDACETRSIKPVDGRPCHGRKPARGHGRPRSRWERRGAAGTKSGEGGPEERGRRIAGDQRTSAPAAAFDLLPAAAPEAGAATATRLIRMHEVPAARPDREAQTFAPDGIGEERPWTGKVERGRYSCVPL